MRTLKSPRRILIVAVGSVALTASACSASSGGSSGSSASSGAGRSVTVGVINSYTGPIANFGPAFEAGFRSALKLITKGTNTVDGVKIKVEVANDDANPATGVSAAKKMLGEGVKMIVGTSSSAVVFPVAQQAIQNHATFIAGETGSDQIVGMSKYVFRSTPSTPMVVKSVALAVKNDGVKKVAYIGQDYAYGQQQGADFAADAKAIGIDTTKVLLPATTQDFTAGVAQALQGKPDAIFVGWAGTGLPQLFTALANQGVFKKKIHVVSIAPAAPAFSAFASAVGPALPHLELITNWAPESTNNATEKAMVADLAHDKAPLDVQHAAGYAVAAMVVRAVGQAGAGLDPDAVSKAIESGTYDTPAGQLTIRPDDHLALLPMFQYTLEKSGSGYALKVTKTLAASELAPPVTTKISN